MASWLSTHSPTACGGGRWCRKAPKGACISNARRAVVKVLAAKGGIKKSARKGALLASAAVLYNSRGRSTQPVREASADPGQNPWRPEPEARWRHQPSRRSRVNLREYWKAPRRSRSRSRPRRKAPEPSSPKGACPYQPSRPSGRSLSTVSPQVSMSSPPAIMTMAAKWNQMKRTTRPMREP